MKKLLTAGDHNSDEIQVRVRDQSVPEKIATVLVRVAIQRDRKTPRFSESKYTLIVDENTAVGTELAPSGRDISASDRDDVQVRKLYT